MSKKRLISPKYRLTAKFADGSEVFGRARQIILGGPGCKIESLTWQGIPVPLDALQALDDGLFVCVNDVP